MTAEGGTYIEDALGISMLRHLRGAQFGVVDILDDVLV